MDIDKVPQWFLALEEEDASFLKNFVCASGSLKEVAALYGVQSMYSRFKDLGL